VQGWTGFAAEFTHLREGNARVADLTTSLCGVLLAETCNVGLEPLVRRDVPALTRGRLGWVQQNYVRAETLITANARLVDAQAAIPLARAWGCGEAASADGLRLWCRCGWSTPAPTPSISVTVPFPDHEARGTARHDAENSHCEGAEVPVEDPGHSACPQQHGRKGQHESADEPDEFSAAHSITPAHTPPPGRQCATALGS